MRDKGDTLQTLGVAAAGAALHFNTRGPQQEIGVGAV